MSVDVIGACVPFPVRQAAQGAGREPAALPGAAAPDAAAAQHGVRQEVTKLLTNTSQTLGENVLLTTAISDQGQVVHALDGGCLSPKLIYLMYGLCESGDMAL